MRKIPPPLIRMERGEADPAFGGTPLPIFKSFASHEKHPFISDWVGATLVALWEVSLPPGLEGIPLLHWKMVFCWL